MGRSVPLVPSQYRDPVVSSPPPQLGLGSLKGFWGRLCGIFCDFASSSEFNSCLEMGDSYIPLLASVGLMFPFNLLGYPTRQLEFLGCLDTHDAHSGCAAA